MDWSLHDPRGHRKYLVAIERRAFLQAALAVGGKTGSFCAVLALCGARLSEVLALTPEHIDDGNCAINFETLKRQKAGVIRAVPVPRKLLYYLDGVHHYRDAQANAACADKPLWPWGRTTAWRRVKFVMRRAKVPHFVAHQRRCVMRSAQKQPFGSLPLH
jgi:integrase